MRDKLSGRDKILLKSQGYNPERFTFLGMDIESFNFKEIQTNKILSLRR